MEHWEPIKDFPGYEISDWGQVRSYRRINHQGEILKATVSSRGYASIILYKDGKGYARLVHRLVAEAFIPNPDQKETVNHIDCDKLNNHVSNLEWMTKSENVIHAYENGLNENVRRRLSEGCAKVHPPVRVIETGRIYQSQRELSRELGLCEQSVSRCLKGGSKSTGGYHFEYVGD